MHDPQHAVTPPRATRWRGHIPALDGLRGIAVLLVMLLHFQLDEPDTPLGRAYMSVVESGWVGVDLFFVLSGFLITGILYDNRTEEGYFRNFYARRALRIFPLYFGFLAVLFFVVPQVVRHPSVDLASPPAQQAWAWLYLTNLQIVLLGPGSESPFTGHFWSLAVEEQFYLLWPAVVLLLARRRLLALCSAMIVAAPVMRTVFVYGFGSFHWAYFFTPSRMDALAIGAVIALVVRAPGGLDRLLRWRNPVLVASTAALAAIYLVRGLSNQNGLILSVGITVVGFFFAAVLVTAVAAEPGTRTERAFAHPLFRFFGRYSYSMYVFHLAVYEVLLATVFAGPVRLSVGGVPVPAQLLFLATGITVTTFLSLASWNLYEKHFLKLKGRFGYGSPSSGRSVPAGSAKPAGAGAPAVNLAMAGD